MLMNDTDPYAYVNELRKTVNVLHENNIRVTLDVVFNHVYRAKDFDLGRMLKGSCFRYLPDGKLAAGTGCGNEVKSEDVFVRAYLVEMVERYLELFDIDGIRMDLMGISDVDTVNLIYDSLIQKKEDFMVYGEGWHMGDVLADDQRASIPNADKMPHIAMFNDFFRETIISYICGNHDIISQVCDAIQATGPLNLKQSLNYTECHDGHTFYDRLQLYKAEDPIEINLRRCQLSYAIPLLSKGIPFIHAGQEFYRTKLLEKNSYNLPDKINQLDWKLRQEHDSSCRIFEDLISIRKENPCFNDPHAEMNFEFHDGLLKYRIGELFILINTNSITLSYDDGMSHHIIFDGETRCEKDASYMEFSPYSVVIIRD